MKKLRITLNEKVYDVSVEILEDDESRYPGSNYSAAEEMSTRPAPVTVDNIPKTQTRRPTAQPPGNNVLAPIVGTVTKILVEPGNNVKENQPLIILDAMKMDTYINAPRSGVVQTIDCKSGDSVIVGQKLITLS